MSVGYITRILPCKCVQLELRKNMFNILAFCYVPLLPATSCQPGALPMGWPGPCRLHHYTLAHKGAFQIGRYSLRQCSMLNAYSFGVVKIFSSTFTLTDITYNFEQVVNTHSPESCWTFLTNLEKRGNPHTDIGLLNKLKDCYSKVFSRLPIRQFSKNTSYARILVRYAELRGWVRIRILKLFSICTIFTAKANHIYWKVTKKIS